MPTESDILVRFLNTTRYDRQFHPYRRPADYRKYIADLERLFALVFISEIHNEAKSPYVTLFPEEWGTSQPECHLLFVDSPHQFKLVVRRDRRFHPYRRPRKYFRRRRIHGHHALADDRLKNSIVPRLEIKPPTTGPTADSVTKYPVENDKNQTTKNTGLESSLPGHNSTTQNKCETDLRSTSVLQSHSVPSLVATKCKEQNLSKKDQIESNTNVIEINKPNKDVSTQEVNNGIPRSCSSQGDITQILKEVDEVLIEIDKVFEDNAIKPVPTGSTLTAARIDSETKTDLNNNEAYQPPTKSSIQSSEFMAFTKQKAKVANPEMKGECATNNGETGSHNDNGVDSSTNGEPCPIVISPINLSNFEVMLNKGIKTEHNITEAPIRSHKDKLIGKQRCRRRWRTTRCHEARPKCVSGTDQNQYIPNKAPSDIRYTNSDTRKSSSHRASPDDDPSLARLKLIRAECLTADTVKRQTTVKGLKPFHPSLAGQNARCSFPKQNVCNWMSCDNKVSIKNITQEERLVMRKRRFGDTSQQTQSSQTTDKKNILIKRIKF